MASQVSGSTTPVEDYERQIAHRREAATLRVTNLVSLGLVCFPIALALIVVVVGLSMPQSALFIAIITCMLMGTLPAGAAAVLALYNWPVLSRRTIALGLFPWSLLVLLSTLIVLEIP